MTRTDAPMTAAEARPVGRPRLAIVLLVAALNLRIAVAALSPVLDDIERDTGVSATVAGLLNTVPVVCFGLFALATPALIRRLGMERLLLLAMTVVTAGIALRLLSPLVALFVGTAVIGAGIAVGNTVLPGLIKQDFSQRAGLMTGLYSVSLFLGAAVSAGLTVPWSTPLGLAGARSSPSGASRRSSPSPCSLPTRPPGRPLAGPALPRPTSRACGPTGWPGW